MENIIGLNKKFPFEFIVSIIIVSYNTADLLYACLKSVENELENSGLTGQAEIFVVDNNSKDGSGEIVKAEFPRVCLIQNNQNLGFGKANNRAITQAKGNYLFFLNPDAEVCRDAIGIMVDFMEKNPNIGLAGTTLVFPDGSSQPSVEETYPGARHAASDLQNLPGDIAWVMGASMIARADLIKKIGGFDERFFLYGEDIDLCLSVRKSGFAVGVISDAVIIHHEGQSERDSLPLHVFEKKLDAAILFFKKYYSEKSRRKIRNIQSLQAIWRIVSLYFELLIFHADQTRRQKLLEYKKILSAYKSL
nr:glycosyltransferase family 2 protein [uncultured Desulfobacter sp.]